MARGLNCESTVPSFECLDLIYKCIKEYKNKTFVSYSFYIWQGDLNEWMYRSPSLTIKCNYTFNDHKEQNENSVFNIKKTERI